MIRTFFLMLMLSVAVFATAQEKTKIIIDADTGNEVDDLYAVVRALIEPSWEVTGINATQWQVSHWAVENTMEESFRLNNVLLAYLGMNDKVVSNRGAEARLFDWGNMSQPSAASNYIIEEAEKCKEGKVNVVALGALTNVASAILDKPEITSKIRLYWLGTTYDFENHVMGNTDFNNVMDIQAIHVILNSDVEFHVIPVSVASQMVYTWEETEKHLKGLKEPAGFLLHRWYDHFDGGRKDRVLWDLALIQAIIFPEMAEEVEIQTSKEKGNRKMWMYKDIDADAMKEEFFKSVSDFLTEKE
jgi:inosine-uridine nucleoside N-ribohydrolase